MQGFFPYLAIVALVACSGDTREPPAETGNEWVIPAELQDGLVEVEPGVGFKLGLADLVLVLPDLGGE